MTEEDEAYKRGLRDQKIASLEKRVGLIEKMMYAVVGAVVASWAKITGFFP